MNLDNLRQRLQNKQIYIYGAGIYATILYAYLQFYGMERQVIGFVVTKKENNVDRFFDKPIYAYSVDIMEKQAAFCIAIKGAYDIEDRLRKDGFGDVCLIAGQVISEIKECIFAEFSNLPIQRTKIFFDSYDGKGYGCNPKYIAEYLLKHHSNLELVWDVMKLEKSELPEQIKQVERYSCEYYRELYTAGIVIQNVGIDGFPYKRKEQYTIHTWHGSGCYKKAGIHACLNNEKLVETVVDNFKNVDLVISNTYGNSKVFRESFLYEGEIAEYGSPRVDIIFRNAGVRDRICKQFHIPTEKKILLYAPTYRDQKDQSFSQYDLDMNSVLEKLEKRFGGEYVLMYRFHQMLYQYDEGKSFYPYGINISMYHDVMEFLVAADVLITDYSSIMWDFGLQRRPIFLYQNDAKQYTDDRGFYKPISTWPYPIAHTQQELLDNIKNFDEQDYLKKLEAFIAADPSYDDGYATERVVARIMDVIEHPEKYGKE